MKKLLAIAVAGFSLLGAGVASAQVAVPADPGYSATEPYGAYGLYSQCLTDEGYGRTGTCDTNGS